MAIEYDIMDPPGVVEVRMTGKITFQEMLGHMRDLERDRGVRPGLRKLLDQRDLESFCLGNTENLRTIATLNHSLNNRIGIGKTAVVSSEDYIYGLIRMYQAVTDVDPAFHRVFREMEEARSWLLLPMLEEEAEFVPPP